MPIIDDDNGMPLIQLGDGDVLISTARQQGATFENEIVLSQQIPHPVGEYTQAYVGQLTTTLGRHVRLQFGGVESLDVLLERLNFVRGQMVTGMNPKSAASAELTGPERDAETPTMP